MGCGGPETANDTRATPWAVPTLFAPPPPPLIPAASSVWFWLLFELKKATGVRRDLLLGTYAGLAALLLLLTAAAWQPAKADFQRRKSESRPREEEGEGEDEDEEEEEEQEAVEGGGEGGNEEYLLFQERRCVCRPRH